jgi:hypothetical protein
MPNPVTGKIGIFEMPGHTTPPGVAIQGSEIDAGAIGPANVGQAGLRPDNLGLLVWNATGGTLTAGTLVYKSGWNAANNLPQMSKASAAGQVTAAQWVVLADILNGASGLVGKHLALGSLNTNAATVGDPVYLDTVAGGYTLTSPPGAGLIYQRVGVVSVKSATVGVVEFDLISGATWALLYRIQIVMPAIGTAAGTYNGLACVERPGTIVGAKCIFPTSLAASDTNYLTLSGVDLIAGAGTNPLLSAVGAANSTKATGGAAIVANTSYPLVLNTTPSNLVVAASDWLTVIATVTGTLANAIGDVGVVTFAIVPA